MKTSPQEIPQESAVTALLHAIGRQLGVLTVSQRKQIKQLSPGKIKDLYEALPAIKSRTDLMRWLREEAL
jgi:hypothetical protein